MEVFYYFCCGFYANEKMKKFFTPYLLFLILTTFLDSCSKEFDSNAPYRDVTIVYGILNADDPVNYIKIYKGFLTDGDASGVASVFDSIYYHPEQIEVKLEAYVGTNKVNEWILDTTTTIPREEGSFSDKQLLYKIDQPLRVDASYLLTIKNNQTGRVITAKTNIVGDFRITQPNVEALNISNATPNPFGFTAPAQGSAYDIYQYFYWLERDKNTHEVTEKCLKRRINSDFISATSMQYVPSTLINAIVANVHPDNNVERYLKMDSCVKFEVWAVSSDLYRYVSTSTITSSVVLDHLIYTNIVCEDGQVAGIFGSRKCSTGWYKLTRQSQQAIVEGELTRNLGFHYFEDFH